jgi:lipoate synthase
MAEFEGEQQKIKIRKDNVKKVVSANLKNMRRNVGRIQPAAELQQDFRI